MSFAPRLTRTGCQAVILLLVLPLLFAITGCSRVTIVYNTADFFVKGYADDYLGLEREQLERWEPRLDAALARHRAEELPYLAAFFARVLQDSRNGFDAPEMHCLIATFQNLYRRHARLVVSLAAPLLADLTPTQVEALERKLNEEDASDRRDLATEDPARERRKRAERYIESIEGWSGPLRPEQRVIVDEITARMPRSQAAVVDYRSRKRTQLIALLKGGADEARIERFMADWLVDFTDLPPELEQAGDAIGERISELFIRLGATFDAQQRRRFETRLQRLSNDLLDLQRQPRLAPLQC